MGIRNVIAAMANIIVISIHHREIAVSATSMPEWVSH